jgi:hypothetical protein
MHIASKLSVRLRSVTEKLRPKRDDSPISCRLHGGEKKGSSSTLTPLSSVCLFLGCVVRAAATPPTNEFGLKLLSAMLCFSVTSLDLSSPPLVLGPCAGLTASLWGHDGLCDLHRPQTVCQLCKCRLGLESGAFLWSLAASFEAITPAFSIAASSLEARSMAL